MATIAQGSAVPQPIPDIYPLSVPSGCALYYDMQEQGSVIIDHSGRGNHGTVSGWPTPVAGPNGLVRLFDGTDDLISRTNMSYYGGVFSIESWLKSGVTTGGFVNRSAWSLLAGMGDENYIHLQYPYALGSNAFVTGRINGGEAQTGSSITSAVGLNWHHVLCTFSGATWTYYYDGSLVASQTKVDMSGMAGTPALYVGSYDGSSRYFKGQIGIVRVYNRALAAADVKTIYQGNAWRYGLAG